MKITSRDYWEFGKLGLCLMPSIVVATLIWWPLRAWAFSQVASGWMKLLIIGVLFWGGGILFPLILVILGIATWTYFTKP